MCGPYFNLSIPVLPGIADRPSPACRFQGGTSQDTVGDSALICGPIYLSLSVNNEQRKALGY
jgi:hypothetical protein